MERQPGKTDLCVIETCTAIKNILKEMICEMSPSEISIKELTMRAMIHRKTFCLHYTFIEVLFEDMLTDVANGYLKK